MPNTAINIAEVLPFIVILFIVGLVWVATETAGRSMLQKWALDHDLLLLHFSPRYWRRGPFFWGTSKNQLVYRITAQSRDGRTFLGWARCGSWMWGIWVNKVETRWDDEVPPSLTFTH